jgi:hypothetical protein
MEGDDGNRKRYQQASDGQGSLSGKARDPLNTPAEGFAIAARVSEYGLLYDGLLRFLRVLNKNAEFGNSAAPSRRRRLIFAPDSKPLG